MSSIDNDNWNNGEGYMETMNDFIEMIRKQRPIMSDAELARTIGITRQAISQLKSGRTKHFSDETAYNIAEVLGIDPAYVLLCLAAERSSDQRVKLTWQRINRFFKNAGTRAAVIALLSMTIFVPSTNKADTQTFSHNATYYTLCAFLRRAYCLMFGFRLKSSVG